MNRLENQPPQKGNREWIESRRVIDGIERGRGKGVKIAVIDTGIEASHPGLKGLRLADDVAITMKGGRLQVSEGSGEDLFGHGTAVAGIIREIAPQAEIGSFRVLGPSSGGRAAVIREAVRFAMDAGYQVLNCSFGCIGRNEFLPGFKQWVDEAYLHNCHIVAASNNEDSGTVEWPSHFPSVIGVTHVEGGGNEEIFYRPGRFVEFGALGEKKDALWLAGSQKRVLGSSFAGPRIAALLACLLSSVPETPVLLAKAALMQYAKKWPGPAENSLSPIPESIQSCDGQSAFGLYLS